jgi:hypothetical protein
MMTISVLGDGLTIHDSVARRRPMVFLPGSSCWPAFVLATVAAGSLFAGLVYAVLVAADLSEPAATTVYGMTRADSGPLRPRCWHCSAWSSAGWLWSVR